MTTTFILVFMLVCCLPLASIQAAVTTTQADYPDTCSKTPEDFPDKYYHHCLNRGLPSYLCKAAWSMFGGAFSGKEPATVVQSDYVNYFKVLPIVAKANESLFWSGTFEMARLLSCMCPTGADLVSSSNTPSAAIINDIGDINWCGNKDGIDYVDPCLCNVTQFFWDQFSVEFASVAKETVFYLANGERGGGAFRDSSAFAQYEVPNLEYPRVTHAVVLNVHRKGRGEACGMGTLIKLQDTLKSKRISYTCYNIYGNVEDESQTKALSMCASIIVNATQKGIDPVPNECYSKEAQDIHDTVQLLPGAHYLSRLLSQLRKIGQQLLNAYQYSSTNH